MFEQPGESTFPVSTYLVKTGGMVVICAGTSGYNLTMDARYIWMRQKRIQGSHFANLYQANQANEMMIQKLIKPLMSECFNWNEIPAAHKNDEQQTFARKYGCISSSEKNWYENVK